MIPAANEFRTQLHHDVLPDGDLSPLERELADAVRHCRALGDFAAAPSSASYTVQVARIAHDCPPDTARAILRDGIRKARKEIERLENALNAYGPEVFIPASSAVPAPRGELATRAEVVRAIMGWVARSGMVLTRAGDRKVVRGPDGRPRLGGPAKFFNAAGGTDSCE